MKKDGRFAEFYKIFLNELYPEFGEIESCRKKLLSKRKKSVLIFIFIIAITFILPSYIFIFKKIGIDIFAIIFAILEIIVPFRIAKTISTIYETEFREYLKQRLITKCLKAFGNIKRPENYAFRENLNGNIISGFDDVFEGEHNGVKFKIIEFYGQIKMFTEEKIDNENKENCLAIVVDFNKKIKYQLDIFSKKEILSKISVNLVNSIPLLLFCLPFVVTLVPMFKASHKPGDYFATFMATAIVAPFVYIGIKYLFKSSSYLDKYFDKTNNAVVLEDPKFNKRFSVYSYNQVEARYLCTPAFMDRLYNLKTVFGANKLKCSFYNNSDGEPKLMIVIHTKKDLFELGDINKPIYEDTAIFEFYKEINSVYQIIDTLKLDSKTEM